MLAAAPPVADTRATTVRLRTAGAGGRVPGALEEAVGASLGEAGFPVDHTAAGDGDIDLVLTVVSMAESGGPATRTMFTLSPTVRGHAMEDITGHFVRSDGGIDRVTVREVCQRFRRRYLRLRTAMADGER